MTMNQYIPANLIEENIAATYPEHDCYARDLIAGKNVVAHYKGRLTQWQNNGVQSTFNALFSAETRFSFP